MTSEVERDYKKVYTKPDLRKRLKDKIKKNSKGGENNRWSARKAQLLKKSYESQGGGYKHPKHKTSLQKSLTKWSKNSPKAKANKGRPSQSKAKSKSNNKNKIALTEFRLPPLSVARNASQGLKLREKFNRGGTSIGVTRANQLKSKTPISLDIIKRMYSYFSRHNVDKKGKNFGNKTNPSAGYIAWLLWGGEEGYKWTKRMLKK